MLFICGSFFLHASTDLEQGRVKVIWKRSVLDITVSVQEELREAVGGGSPRLGRHGLFMVRFSKSPVANQKTDPSRAEFQSTNVEFISI